MHAFVRVKDQNCDVMLQICRIREDYDPDPLATPYDDCGKTESGLFNVAIEVGGNAAKILDLSETTLNESFERRRTENGTTSKLRRAS